MKYRCRSISFSNFEAAVYIYSLRDINESVSNKDGMEPRNN